jgi:hypothetical protein
MNNGQRFVRLGKIHDNLQNVDIVDQCHIMSASWYDDIAYLMGEIRRLEIANKKLFDACKAALVELEDYDQERVRINQIHEAIDFYEAEGM